MDLPRLRSPLDRATVTEMSKRRLYRDAKGRFISKAEWTRQRQTVRRRLSGRPRKGRYSSEEEKILDDVRRSLRPQQSPRGTEFEWTAKYSGSGQNRPMDVTLRVTLTRSMTAEEARLLVERGVRSRGDMPPGIMVRGLDWQRGNRDGSYTGERESRTALRRFAKLISMSQTRFDRVS